MRPEQLDLLTSVSAPSVQPGTGTIAFSTSTPSFDTDSYRGQIFTVTAGESGSDSGSEAGSVADSETSADSGSLATETSTPRRWTRGENDQNPVFSPDGSMLAFTRAVDGTPQIFIAPTGGGEPWQATDRKLSASDYVFSPDSSALVFVSREPDQGRYGTIDGVEPGAEDPRIITVNKYQANGVGFIKDRPSQVFIVEVTPEGPEPLPTPVGRAAKEAANPEIEAEKPTTVPEARALHPSSLDQTAPRFGAEGLSADRFSADASLGKSSHAEGVNAAGVSAEGVSETGSSVYFVTTVGEDADDTLESTIVRVPITGGELEPVTNRHGDIASTSNPWPSQDGKRLYFLAISLGRNVRDFVARNPTLMVLDLDSGAEQQLTDPDIDYVSAIFEESTEGGLLFSTWERGEHILRRATQATPDAGSSNAQNSNQADKTVTNKTVTDNVATNTDAAPASTQHHISALTSSDVSIHGAAYLDPGRVAVSFRSGSTNGDIGVVRVMENASPAQVRPLTDLSTPLRTHSAVAESRSLDITGPDGYPIHGWVLTPPGVGPHPVLLNIHGGPFHAYDSTYFDEAQVYVEAGYALVMCNPRGSASYGRAHGLGIKDDFGTVDMQDVLAFLDHALTLPGLDKDRVGIMGGSYGGYLTAWIISHTDRFAASIVERGFLEPLSFQGTSDIGSFFGDEYVGTTDAAIARQSPMAHIAKVSTPTMVMHSELDLRCPLEQGQRYFAQLKRQGVPTEFVVFPGENHELTRSGTPWHRRRRFEIILDWFGRYLPVRG